MACKIYDEIAQHACPNNSFTHIRVLQRKGRVSACGKCLCVRAFSPIPTGMSDRGYTTGLFASQVPSNAMLAALIKWRLRWQDI